MTRDDPLYSARSLRRINDKRAPSDEWAPRHRPHALLEPRGLPKHKHSPTAANLLNLSYSTAYRRLHGPSPLPQSVRGNDRDTCGGRGRNQGTSRGFRRTTQADPRRSKRCRLLPGVRRFTCAVGACADATPLPSARLVIVIVRPVQATATPGTASLCRASIHSKLGGNPAAYRPDL